VRARACVCVCVCVCVCLSKMAHAPNFITLRITSYVEMKSSHLKNVF